MPNLTKPEPDNPSNKTNTLTLPAHSSRTSVSVPCGRMLPGERIPGWARKLGVRGWARVNELLYDGWQVAAVLREMGLQDKQLNSLQKYAERYRDRRITAPVARVREMLAKGAEEIAPGMVTAIKMIKADANDEKLTAEQRLAATNLVVRFTEHIERIGRNAELKELEEQKIDKAVPSPVDVKQLVAEVYDALGITKPDITPKDGNGRVGLVAPLDVSGNGKQ